MFNDFEYLYMARMNDESALRILFQRYQNLIWKRAHEFFLSRAPIGTVVEDLFQEGTIGFYDSLYSYDESMNVGLAYYIQLCVESSIRTYIRKCRSKSYTLLDSKNSLDMTISEDQNLFLIDMVMDQSFQTDPVRMYYYLEAKRVEAQVLSMLTEVERMIYKLKYEGYSYRYIAQKLGKSEKYVDNTLQKIKRILLNEGNSQTL